MINRRLATCYAKVNATRLFNTYWQIDYYLQLRSNYFLTNKSGIKCTSSGGMRCIFNNDINDLKSSSSSFTSSYGLLFPSPGFFITAAQIPYCALPCHAAIFSIRVITFNEGSVFFNFMCNSRWMSAKSFCYFFEWLPDAYPSFYCYSIWQVHLSASIVIIHICSFPSR